MNGKKKKKSAQRSSSLLSRWFKGGADKSGAGSKSAGKGGKPAAKARPKAQTPLDRSIQEIKHMAKVGESDPERLAMLLSRLLGKEQAKQQEAQEQFDNMVWDIVNKDKDEPDDGTADGPAVTPDKS